MIGISLSLTNRGGSGGAPVNPNLINVSPGAGSLTYTGFPASVTGIGPVLMPATAALTYTGQAPAITGVTKTVSPAVGVLTYTGRTPTVDIAGAGASAPTWVMRSGSSPAAYLDVDFCDNLAWNNGALTTVSSLLSCARASAGTYTNALGVVSSFSSNTLRNGTNGLLVEGAGTNLTLRSQDLSNAAWSASGVTVAAFGGGAPDGTSTAWTLTEAATGGIHGIGNTTAITVAAGTYTLSAYFRVFNRDYYTLGMWTGAEYASAVFRLPNAEIGPRSGALINYAITTLGSGWFRLSITAASATSALFFIGTSDGSNVFSSGRPTHTGNTGVGARIWGVQFEAGNVASSYIPTTAASATRAADIVTFNDLTWLSGTTDSIYAEHAISGTTDGYPIIDGSNGTIWAIDAANDKALSEQLSSTVVQAATVGTDLIAPVMGTQISGASAVNPLPDIPWIGRSAARLSANNFALSFNGSAVATDISETAPGTLTAARLGCSLAGANHINSYIRRFACFKGLGMDNSALATLEPTWVGTDIAGLSTKTTTGTITSGSNLLTVASVTGFTVGQKIIVAVGGEPGAGLRGTMGVGGSWPALSYANAAERDLDVSQPAYRVAWLRDTGNNYQWDPVGLLWADPFSTFYYWAKAVPRALIATITAINGSILTLSTTASASATNAEVSVDNLAALTVGFNKLAKAQIPSGVYAVSDVLEVGKLGLQIRGMGMDSTEIKIPDGVFAATSTLASVNVPVVVKSSPYAQISDFTVRGNGGLNGYGLGPVSETIGTGFPALFNVSLSRNVALKRLRLIDPMRQAFSVTGACNNTWAYDCQVINSQKYEEYMGQWQYQWSQCYGGGLIGCSFDSDWLTNAFERFSCYGGVWYNCTSRNGTSAMNASAGFTIRNFDLTFEANIDPDPARIAPGNIDPMGFTANTGGGVYTDPCLLENVNIVVEGASTAAGKYPRGITVDSPLSLLIINDCSFTSPGYDAALRPTGRAEGLNHGVDRADVVCLADGFVCSGIAGPAGYYNIQMYCSGRTTNCVGTTDLRRPI